GSVNTAGVTFNNSTQPYTITTDDNSGITGLGSVIKNGTGTVTLNTSNSYSGVTNINAGVLNLQNKDALGNTSSVTVANGAALEVQGSIATTAAPLVLNGAGLSANPA